MIDMPVLSITFRLATCLMVLVLSTGTLVRGQTTSDTLVAFQSFTLGDSLLRANQHQQASHHFALAAKAYKANRYWARYVVASARWATSERLMYRLDTAIAIATKAIHLSQRHVELPNPHHADLLYSLAVSYYLNNQYDEALSFANQCLAMRLNLFEPSHASLAEAYNFLGVVYWRNGLLEKATEFLLKNLNIQLSHGDGQHMGTAQACNNLGVILQEKGSYDDALQYLLKTKAIYQAIGESAIEGLGNSYNNIGVAYIHLGQYDRALEYLQEAYRIRSSLKDYGKLSVAECINNIGVAYEHQQKYQLAREHFQKALDIRLESLGESHQETSTSFYNVGVALRYAKVHDKAHEYFEKALKITKMLFGETHPNLVDVYDNIGENYKEQQKYQRALASYEQSLSIGLAVLGNKHPLVAQAYAQIGSIWLLKAQPQQALAYFQKALCANLLDFENTDPTTLPPIKGFMSEKFLISFLKDKGVAFQQLYEQSGQLSQLKLALAHFNLCAEAIGQARQNQSRHKDKLSLSKIAASMYKNAAQTCLLLYEATQDLQYVSHAFQFSESSKSMLLNEKILDQFAKRSSGIPDSLLRLERKLKADRSYYYGQMASLNAGEAGYDTALFLQYENYLFAKNQRLDSLKGVYERDFPRYHTLKYATKPTSLKGIQHKLDKTQAILEYFEIDEAWLLFVITREKVAIHKVTKDNTLSEALSGYMKSFDKSLAAWQSDYAYKIFTKHAYTLYNKLLMQGLSHLPTQIDRLTIVPDGVLTQMPWDTFLALPIAPEDEANYANLPYLFKQYKISYAHSGNLLYKGPNGIPQLNGQQSGLLAFAPAYESTYTPDTIQSPHHEVFRDELSPLRWTSREARKIAEHFQGSSLLGGQATESAFKAQAERYQILHLAMHALIDPQDPMMSTLVFTPDKDSVEDGYLHVYELLNMELTASMAVLSACNTGIGQLQQGEGILSLGRAFAYAGCPSIVMSHWAVPDKSTAQLMEYFYEALAKGETKDAALQQARKQFLAKADVVRAHPIYWAGFVVVGDNNPLPQQTSILIQASILSLLAFAIFIGVFLWRHNKGKAAWH